MACWGRVVVVSAVVMLRVPVLPLLVFVVIVSVAGMLQVPERLFVLVVVV
jgi:hypothetical protein